MKDLIAVLFVLYLLVAAGVLVCLHDSTTALLWPVLAVRYLVGV